MASINLDIGSRFDSSGLDSMNKGIKGAASNVKRASDSLGSVVDKLGEMDGAIGKAVKSGGDLISKVMSAGIWGAVAAAVGLVVAKFADLQKQLKENREAARALNKDIASGEMARRAEARVDRQLARKAAKEKKAAEEAAKARMEADKKAAEEHNRIIGMQKASMKANAADADRASKIEMAQAKLDGVDGDTLALMSARAEVEKAKRALQYAEKFGEDVAKAEDELALAEISLAQTIKDQERAAQREMDEAIEALEAADRKREAEEDAALVRADADKKVAEIDKRLADARKRAAEGEERAQRARGVSFNDWQRGEKERDREAAKEAKKQQGFIDRAAREQEQIGSRIFDRNGRLRKGASKADIEKWKKLNEFAAMQDPNNNAALNEVEKLEKQKAKLIEDTKKVCDDLLKEVRDNVSI